MLEDLIRMWLETHVEHLLSQAPLHHSRPRQVGTRQHERPQVSDGHPVETTVQLSSATEGTHARIHARQSRGDVVVSQTGHVNVACQRHDDPSRESAGHVGGVAEDATERSVAEVRRQCLRSVAARLALGSWHSHLVARGREQPDVRVLEQYDDGDA